MSHGYQTVLWSARKKQYDLVILGLMVLYLIVFIGLQIAFYPEITAETLIIRATGTLAFLMLHVILAIGPLSRLNKRFLPLLYNRRHLGVSMFLMALIHGVFNIIQFHALGDVNPFLSIFTSNEHYDSLGNFPFQTLGFFALLILFVMAATSHDFWLKNLSPKVWKALHMGVYVAYVLIFFHVLLGTFQREGQALLFGVMSVGGIFISGLHIAAGRKSRTTPNGEEQKAQDFIRVCALSEIPENRAKVALIGHENIAIFKYDNTLSAIHNLCKHQNGPLGEGKIIDGCITCPWHGYQYLPHNGQSPPPFTEKVKTYEVKVIDGAVYVNPNGHPEGTEITPTKINE